MTLLWVAFPLLQHFGLEEFSLPNDLATTFTILGAAMSGAAFMTGTMVKIVPFLSAKLKLIIFTDASGFMGCDCDLRYRFIDDSLRIP
ncbi:hypothetical protein BT96DRAFT_914101, partial [Gymnopus androsaceus JB14]